MTLLEAARLVYAYRVNPNPGLDIPLADPLECVKQRILDLKRTRASGRSRYTLIVLINVLEENNFIFATVTPSVRQGLELEKRGCDLVQGHRFESAVYRVFVRARRYAK
jgi:hypothetical protein